MAVRYRHTWGVTAFVAALLLCLQADAKGRSTGGEVLVTGPGGESALHTNANQVQVWSCHAGTMSSCTIRSEGGGPMTPSGRQLPPGQRPNWKVDYARFKKQSLARHKR